MEEKGKEISMIVFKMINGETVEATDIISDSLLKNERLQTMMNGHKNMITVMADGKTPAIVNLDNVTDIWQR